VIYDEVLTGACRTGTFWAWERSGPDAAPDLMCAGKGIGGGVAIAALLGRAKLMDVWRRHVAASGEAPHASTFYGHPLACAGALATLKRLASPELRTGVSTKGAQLERGLEELARRHTIVGGVRCAGLLAAMDVVDDERRNPAPDRARGVFERLLQGGVLSLPSGLRGSVLMFLPPLTVTESQLSRGLDILDQALRA
jgi:4-aminobutyrate aminotransferase / (S)-3-amino-2-methylpropionate transaminase / 5-aminovalerate transaminase